MEFQVGDVVQLKSGGPIMTVSTKEESKVQCAWFASDDESNVCVSLFPPAVLQAYTGS